MAIDGIAFTLSKMRLCGKAGALVLAGKGG